MINENLLKSLEPNDDPVYFLAIKKIEPFTECNQDTLKITLHQINKNLNTIEASDPNITEKTLTISSNLDIDNEGLYKTKLVGYESYSKKLIENNEELNGLSSHKIELLQTTLSKKIDIEFNEAYDSEPAIVVTINKKYETLYRSYSTDFIKNDGGKYIGVTIIFNSLKTKQTYPDIKITIIGDIKETITEEENTEEESTEGENTGEENTGGESENSSNENNNGETENETNSDESNNQSE